jgi:hypothetical protein
MLESLNELPAHLPELPLSYGLESLIRDKIEENDGAITVEGLATCALRLWPEKVVQQHIEDLSLRFVNRVERLAKARAETEDSKEPSGSKKTFGSTLEDWTQTLDPTGLCLYLADYDPERAHRLYWWVEADLLEMTLKSKLRFESVKHSNAREAAIYGFGGSYEGDGKTEEVLVGDLDTGALAVCGINF